MPALNNPKREAFCQHRAAGKSKDEAYALAGFKPSRQSAHRLSTNADIQIRLMELQEGRAEKYEVTAESIAAQLDEDRAAAYKHGQISAAVSATMGKAKLFGLISDKSVVNVTHNYAMMTVEELKFEIAAIHAEARAIKAGVQH